MIQYYTFNLKSHLNIFNESKIRSDFAEFVVRANHKKVSLLNAQEILQNCYFFNL